MRVRYSGENAMVIMPTEHYHRVSSSVDETKEYLEPIFF